MMSRTTARLALVLTALLMGALPAPGQSRHGALFRPEDLGLLGPLLARLRDSGSCLVTQSSRFPFLTKKISSCKGRESVLAVPPFLTMR